MNGSQESSQPGALGASLGDGIVKQVLEEKLASLYKSQEIVCVLIARVEANLAHEKQARANYQEQITALEQALKAF